MTNIEDLNSEILKELQRYSNLLEDDLQQAIADSSKELVQDLKNHSPVRKGPAGGDYAKGWAIKKKGKLRNIVHNKTDYRLTHLLEKGHAKRNGGRVAAQVHIAPAEQRAIADFLERIERAIRLD